MQVISSLHNLSLPPSVATIGFFDGVHRGHQYLIKQVTQEANAKRLASLVITFSNHPSKVIHDKQIKELTPLKDKLSLLDKEGIDYCVVLPFTDDLSKLSAYDFMLSLLKNKLNINTLYIGYDNRFGHNREENFHDYVSYGKQININVLEAKALLLNNEEVSSSFIRSLLKKGKVELANTFLGYDYSIKGLVVDGNKIGRKLGFPTANIQPLFGEKLIPSDGVYAVVVNLNNKSYKAMLSIGYRPTLKNGKNRTIEVNILDFNSDIYGMELEIVFKKYLREEILFDSLDELIVQLHKDEATVRHYFGKK